MSALLADTHALIWFLFDSPQLSEAARQAMDEAVRRGDGIVFSAITLVEIIYLIEKGRLPPEVLTRLLACLADSQGGLQVFAVDLQVANAVAKISRDAIPDMPDRLIAATALHLGVPLVTRDARIRLAGLSIIW